MSRRRDDETVAGNASGLDVVYLCDEHGRVYDHSVGDDRRDGAMQHAAGYELQGELFFLYHYRVACVVAALVANHHIGFFCQQVYYLAFAFVAPLHSDDDSC